MAENSADTVRLLERLRAGDREALNEVFTRHRGRMRRMVEMRMDWRLQARLDASDVIQEAFLEADMRMNEYLRDPALPLFLWLRLIVGERLIRLHRQHLGAKMRDADREVSLYRQPLPAASSMALAAQLLGKHTSPTQAAVRAERAALTEPTRVYAAANEALDVSATQAADTSSSAVLPGQTDLSNVPTDRPHYFQSVARIGWQTASALAHAHARGIIHRDIKPSNLLLDMAGAVWITDFGLAKTHENSLTTTGDIVGTLRYMAPERLQGEGDERGDVYALGLTLYEMLLLRPAFAAHDRLQLIDRIKNQEPAWLRAVDRRIPRDLETIVLKAMDKEAKRRYPSAEAMAEDLRRFLAHEPIQARRTSQLGRLRLWGRRNPAIASLLSVSFLLLFGLIASLAIAALWLNEKRIALELSDKGKTEQLYESLVAQANASRFSRQVGQRFDTLVAVRRAAELVRRRHMPAERLDKLRTLAIAALVLPDLRTLRTWEGLPGGSFAWDIDDQLRSYARSDLEGHISLRAIDSDEEIARLEGWRGETWLHFSPGDRFLLARENRGRFRVWNLSATPPQQVLEGVQHRFAFHPDGQHLLVGMGNGSMSLHDLADPKQKPVVLKARQSPLAFDPSGNRLAAIEAGKVHILDAKTGKVLSSFPESHPSSGVAWHPSGNYLALVCSHRELHVWDRKRMRRMSVCKGCRNGGIYIAFTPDGERLLSQGWEGVIRVWDWRTARQVLHLLLRPERTALREPRITRITRINRNNSMALLSRRRPEDAAASGQNGPQTCGGS